MDMHMPRQAVKEGQRPCKKLHHFLVDAHSIRQPAPPLGQETTTIMSMSVRENMIVVVDVVVVVITKLSKYDT